ncbi:hypothetical protein C8N43_2077 [Litoreibacter ponti]|uniref:Uncharacterized protein n=1 Tax=Litoreibacter ponti TaxID=1510457 RepID=A0A2T6BMU2_9RHOB|nr:hypothetical protein [Litoreibacter ponti]PTX57410.1 hypothetical protein C8N43_2077 [Litoreibacter ponti]
MDKDWLIDVLIDLEVFSRKNDLYELTVSIQRAKLIAVKEISGLTASKQSEETGAQFLL